MKFKTFKKVNDAFRGLYGIYLKLMKDNRKITTSDRLTLETLLGSLPIVHAQESPWTLDVGHVDNLNEVSFFFSIV